MEPLVIAVCSGFILFLSSQSIHSSLASTFSFLLFPRCEGTQTVNTAGDKRGPEKNGEVSRANI